MYVTMCHPSGVPDFIQISQPLLSQPLRAGLPSGRASGARCAEDMRIPGESIVCPETQRPNTPQGFPFCKHVSQPLLSQHLGAGLPFDHAYLPSLRGLGKTRTKIKKEPKSVKYVPGLKCKSFPRQHILVAPTALGVEEARATVAGIVLQASHCHGFLIFADSGLQCATPPGFLILYKLPSPCFPSPCGLG